MEVVTRILFRNLFSLYFFSLLFSSARVFSFPLGILYQFLVLSFASLPPSYGFRSVWDFGCPVVFYFSEAARISYFHGVQTRCFCHCAFWVDGQGIAAVSTTATTHPSSTTAGVSHPWFWIYSWPPTTSPSRPAGFYLHSCCCYTCCNCTFCSCCGSKTSISEA